MNRIGDATLEGLFTVSLALATSMLAPECSAALVSGGRVMYNPPYEISERARALRDDMLIVDLHADSLLWGSDLLQKNRTGHVDVPRLIEGGVGAQVFGIVTKVPPGLKLEGNDGRSDSITLLTRVNNWPEGTRHSLMQRALYQAGRLHEFAARSDGRLIVVRSRAEWEGYLKLRRERRDIVAGLLSIEGAHALEGDLANLDKLYDAGVRMISPSHFFDTDIGGSAHGTARGGLSELGRQMIRRMEEKGMIVDLAHASPKVIEEVVAMATRPVVISHTGVRGTCNNPRNLDDGQLRAIARTGGVIGIGFWDVATCDINTYAIVKAIRHAANIVGADHVALGSDFDGSVTTPFDATGIGQLIDGLLKQGFSEAEIRKIMGENVSALFLRTLPAQ
jgi:membrane dipeptidase